MGGRQTTVRTRVECQQEPLDSECPRRRNPGPFDGTGVSTFLQMVDRSESNRSRFAWKATAAKAPNAPLREGSILRSSGHPDSVAMRRPYVFGGKPWKVLTCRPVCVCAPAWQE